MQCTVKVAVSTMLDSGRALSRKNAAVAWTPAYCLRRISNRVDERFHVDSGLPKVDGETEEGKQELSREGDVVSRASGNCACIRTPIKKDMIRVVGCSWRCEKFGGGCQIATPSPLPDKAT